MMEIRKLDRRCIHITCPIYTFGCRFAIQFDISMAVLLERVPPRKTKLLLQDWYLK